MDKYKEWPLGIPPKELQRKELDKVRELGYDWKDARDVVTTFEEKVAKFAGSKYACAVDSCTNGIFLALKHHEHFYGHEQGFRRKVTIQRATLTVTWINRHERVITTVSIGVYPKHVRRDVEGTMACNQGSTASNPDNPRWRSSGSLIYQNNKIH